MMGEEYINDPEFINKYKNKVEAYRAIIMIFREKGISLKLITNVHNAEKELHNYKISKLKQQKCK